MRINIYTNTQKSQFRQVKDGIWQILGIPITVDDAVMNGILYEKEENAKGLATYRGQPVTLRHPEDENGNGISAMSGKAMMDHFSGGVIINTYNNNGVNYADAEFKEKMMLAQDNGEYYVNRLKNGEPIGISTGLFFDGNNESGVNACGKEYHAKAKNQIGDHVAMLPDDEPPAGGAATFIRFNGENDDQTITVNIDEMLKTLGDIDEVINGIATNEQEKSLLARFFAACKQAFAHNKNNCDNANDNNLINNKEGDAMRETLIAALAAKGITVNAEISDAELLAKYNESNTPDIAAAVNKAIAPLTETVKTLQAELAGNKDKELDALAKQAAPFMGLEEAEAKALGANALHKVLAKNGVVVGAPNGTNSQSPKDKEGSTISMKPWETK
jgi:hypothetical protein